MLNFAFHPCHRPSKSPLRMAAAFSWARPAGIPRHQQAAAITAVVAVRLRNAAAVILSSLRHHSSVRQVIPDPVESLLFEPGSPAEPYDRLYDRRVPRQVRQPSPEDG